MEKRLLEAKELINQKEYANAKSILLEVLSLANSPIMQFPILNLLGTCSFGLAKHQEGVNYLQMALELPQNNDDGTLSQTYYMIGLGYYYLREYDIALGYLNKSISLNPTFIYSYRIRGECFFKTNDYVSAVGDLEKWQMNVGDIEEIDDNNRPIVALAACYLQIDEIIKATKLLLKAVRINPNDEYVRITLSTIMVEYLGKDGDSEIPSLLIKGKLYSQIANYLSPENSARLVNGIQTDFIEKFEHARRRKPNMVIIDILNLSSQVATDMFNTWENSEGTINNIQKSYLTYEVAKVIQNFEFFKMELDELHKDIFQPAFLSTLM